MFKTIIFIALISIFTNSCTPGMRYGSNSNLTEEQKIQEMNEQYKIVQDKINNHEITFAGGDGSTIENAIIIVGAKTDRRSVISEQIYFMNKFGTKGQDWQIGFSI